MAINKQIKVKHEQEEPIEYKELILEKQNVIGTAVIQIKAAREHRVFKKEEKRYWYK